MPISSVLRIFRNAKNAQKKKKSDKQETLRKEIVISKLWFFDDSMCLMKRDTILYQDSQATKLLLWPSRLDLYFVNQSSYLPYNKYHEHWNIYKTIKSFYKEIRTNKYFSLHAAMIEIYFEQMSYEILNESMSYLVSLHKNCKFICVSMNVQTILLWFLLHLLHTFVLLKRLSLIGCKFDFGYWRPSWSMARYTFLFFVCVHFMIFLYNDELIY